MLPLYLWVWNISGEVQRVNNTNNTTCLCALVLLKYEDSISFIKIFKYLNEYYSFNPKIVNIDYSASLTKALQTDNIFKDKPIIIHCFFHFGQCIVKKLKELKIIKKKLTKYGFELLRNIEIICFLPYGFIKSYIKFLKTKLNGEKEKKLFQYLEKNWFTKQYHNYNYL